MSDEAWRSLVIIIPSVSAAVTVAMRVLSHKEHKKTEKTVGDIYLILNGEFLKKIEQAKEEGRQEERNKRL